MPTLRLDLAYDGTGFRGYARQEGQRTVQGELESALVTVLGAPVSTAVAGRTDAGVHARGQVASVVTEGAMEPERLRRSLNGLLGPEVSVREVTVVPDDFDARRSARWRSYRYALSVDPVPDPFTRWFTWETGRRLDLDAMSRTAVHFLGERDFTAFCRSRPPRSNLRRVEEARWEDAGAGRLHFWVKANAFCHQMVRSLVGLCYDVGRGFTDVTEVSGIVDSGDRSRVATVAPPHGLVLWEVGY